MASNRIWGDRNSEKIVILDSSGILMIFEYSIQIKDQLLGLIGKHKIVIPITIKKELEKLSIKGKGKTKINARAALEYIKQYDILDFQERMKADDSLLVTAKKVNGLILTNDSELRRRAKKEGIKTVFLRGRQRLAIS